MTQTYTDAQVAEVVEQVRRTKPPSASCPACDTTLSLEPMIWRLIDRNGDDPDLLGIRFNDHWDVLRVEFDCPNCGGVGHVSLEQQGQRS